MRIVTALLIATVCFADERAGLRPRPSRDDYSARAGNKNSPWLRRCYRMNK